MPEWDVLPGVAILPGLVFIRGSAAMLARGAGVELAIRTVAIRAVETGPVGIGPVVGRRSPCVRPGRGGAGLGRGPARAPRLPGNAVHFTACRGARDLG